MCICVTKCQDNATAPVQRRGVAI